MLQLISLILLVYQKHTLILVLLLMKTIWKFLGTRLFVQTTRQTIKRVVFAFTIKAFSVSNVCKKVFVFELKIGNKTCNFLSLHRSPSQSQDDFETFTEKLDWNLENLVQRNPFFIVAIGHFNANSRNWFCHDKTSFEGNVIEKLTSQFGLHKVIKEPTHILDTSSLCIDLIFTLQPNLIIASGVHSFLHSSCHHRRIFAKLNLEVV